MNGLQVSEMEVKTQLSNLAQYLGLVVTSHALGT